MRLSLQSYFDLGFSLGLGDAVFRPASEQRVPDIAKVGISNPLGQGLVLNLSNPDLNRILEEWRKRAIGKVADPDMELGSRSPEFKEELISNIKRHPIERCELTIYAVGLVFVRMDHASGIPLEFIQGFHKCYEFAAYSVEISEALCSLVLEAVDNQVGRASNRLRELSRRPEPEIQTDAKGYRESKMFTGFSCIGLCIDKDDDMAAIMEKLRAIEGNDFEELVFDYHGKLHFGWAACVLEPKPEFPKGAIALEEMDRMLQCIQIAHVFLGVCQAFESLFLQETRKQVDGYVKGTKGRSSTELNRLRTLALAVVTLTRYVGVAEADEDQRYFACWEEHAKIKDRHDKIQQQCELLYNVQVAETQAEEAKRERRLNRVVLFLTAFTLVSVLIDSYGFIDYKEGWFSAWIHRAWALASIILVVGLTLTVILKMIERSRRG